MFAFGKRCMPCGHVQEDSPMENLLFLCGFAAIHARSVIHERQVNSLRSRFTTAPPVHSRAAGTPLPGAVRGAAFSLGTVLFYADFTQILCVSLLKSCMVSVTIQIGV